jgi:F-type H+-transporting ATPase subunit b
MKFDLWTFVFQVINFGVLLWILKRILYRPVRDMMEQRRAQAVKKLEEAEHAREEAKKLQLKCQEDQKELAAQRTRLFEEMKMDVAQERQRMLAEADQEAQRHIEKGRALYEAEKKRQSSEILEQAIVAVELFSTKILQSIADPELHMAIIRKFKNELDDVFDKLGDVTGSGDELSLEIASAYPFKEEEEQKLRQELEQSLGSPVKLTLTTDRNLIAGLKMRSGDFCFDGSLSGQLAAFTREARKKD